MRGLVIFALVVGLAGPALAEEAKASKDTKASAFADRWQYVSETSAVIYWRLPEIKDAALSYVEYGETTAYGKKTALSHEPRWAQFHRLTGLETGKTYHVRMVNVDPATKKETRSEDTTVAPAEIAGAVRIPDGMQGPPYVLDKPGAKYVLTKDVVADGTAFTVSAADVTLDLDGHTVRFGDNFNNSNKEQANGVAIAAQGPATVCNGHVTDSPKTGQYSAGVQTRYRAFPLALFGVSTDVSQKCVYPVKIFGKSKDLDIHHNVLYSRVTELESRHYPGNDLLRLDGIDGNVKIHDNILTEGCHIGIRVGGPEEKGAAAPPQGVDIHHNDIRHHQQYTNGYALGVSCPGADIHHNRITSSGRCVHLTAPGILYHDNWADTKNHMDLDDLPQGSRPWNQIWVELHGIKFEGDNARDCKVYNNFMRITQFPPVEATGEGDPADKVTNGVYLRSKATSIEGGKLIDSTMSWENERWKKYWVKYASDKPPVQIKSNDRTGLTADFAPGAQPGEYTIFYKWDYVPATPLNIACYNKNAMNEVYNNEIVAITYYRKIRRGGYGDSGQWASSIYFVGMKNGKADEGKYTVYIHDNVFKSNDVFVSGDATNMDIRIEKNKFILLSDPAPTDSHAVFFTRGLGQDIQNAVKAGGNEFIGMSP